MSRTAPANEAQRAARAARLEAFIDRLAPTIMAIAATMFALALWLYGVGAAGAEEVAYSFVGITGALSALLARGQINRLGAGSRIPFMWPVVALFAMAAYVCGLEVVHDPGNGHTIVLTMFSHANGMGEMIAKSRAGEPTN